MKNKNINQLNYYTMKKFRTTALMALTAIVIVAFVGCTKDNDNPNNGGNGGGSYQTKIVGEWECISEDGDLFVFERGKIYEFTSDGTVITGGTNLPYQINDNTLSITWAATFSFQIEELTDTEMTLSAPNAHEASHIDYARFNKL